jgi:soluble lytic murein transglycosylase-like protein
VVLSHRRLAAFSPLIAIASIALLGPPGRDSSSLPVTEARGASAEALSAQLSANDAALRAAIDAWRAGDDPPKAPPPREVMAPARDLQRKVRSLAQHPSLARNTIALLPRPLASDLRALIGASRDLRELSAGWPPHPVKTGEPRSLAELMRYYDGANRRYDVGQHYLAAIHHVESKFGRVKSDSVAGAKGPMQFLPSTWEIYGRGGDIQDPHDAILAAANLLDDNGAPGDYRRALHAYNPSQLYVDAVQRYARLIKRDSYAVYFLYCWGP